MDDSQESLLPRETFVCLRKLRKKLRQIERLELLALETKLSEEEQIKVDSKRQTRKELQDLLKSIDLDEIDPMKRQGVSLDDSEIAKKKGKNIKSEPVDESENIGDYLLNSSSGSSNPGLENTGDSTPSFSNDTSPQDSESTVKDNTTRSQESSSFSQIQGECSQAVSKRENESKGDGASCSSKKEDRSQVTKAKENQDISPWKDSCYHCSLLEGHNDVILSVDCTDQYILSASRDTTVKVWHSTETTERRSLRGHTAAVTAVEFLPAALVTALKQKFESDLAVRSRLSSDRCVFAASGSLDCTLRVWDITTGENLGSIYTYNGITTLRCGDWGVVTGTEGGKLELWSISTDQRLAFANAFECQVKALHVKGNHIYAGSVGGEVGIWQYVPSSKSLSSVFVMEPESHTYVPLNRLSTIVSIGGVIYLGDGGPNVKVLDWKKGYVTRLANHIGDIGMTDSMMVSSDGHLLSSSYNIDTGCSSINVRDGRSGKYIISFLDRDEGRYLSMSCAPGLIVTGGHLLKVWNRRDVKDTKKKGKHPNSSIVHPTVLRKLGGKPVESASEEDTDWASSDDEDDVQLHSHAQGSVPGDPSENENGRWCTIL